MLQVVLVSECEKKSALRTRSLFDRYLVRSSTATWTGRVSREVLEDMQRALRRVATRQTAVACFVRQGKRGMVLAWTVGRPDAFTMDGAFAIATRSRPPRALPPWAATAGKVARVAGLAHDLGKGSIHFQEKLFMPGTVKDSTRHEWTSMKLYQAMRGKGFDWNDAWETVGVDPKKHCMAFHDGAGPVLSPEAATDLVIATHHGLFHPEEDRGAHRPTPVGHTRRSCGKGDERSLFTPSAEMPSALLVALKRAHDEMMSAGEEIDKDADYWRAITIVARAALILADHDVSAIEYDRKSRRTSGLAANSKRGGGRGAPRMNQPLEWHLARVGKSASDNVRLFSDPCLPGLSGIAVDSISGRSGAGRFAWQDAAFDHLRGMRDEGDAPTLVFDLAGTGSGKTRMNAKSVVALTCEGEPVRLAAGFNLRTLTLQTYSAFRKELELGEAEVSCVIGDRFTKEAMRDPGKVDVDNTDENPEEDVKMRPDTVGTSGHAVFPEWLEEMAVGNPSVRDLIGAPVLVSTMDYLVKAGEPGRQGHHARALLRIASSDLILDEVDGYDATSLIAVLRVVQMAGMFGRNVVVSSATLPEPVAENLYRVFRSGVAMFSALHDAVIQPRIAFIDDRCAPSDGAPAGTEEFKHLYRERLDEIVSALRRVPVYRMPSYADIPEPHGEEGPEEVFGRAIENAVLQMHRNNSWHHVDGKRVSFGLVRVANVKPCVNVTRRLGRLPNVHVTAYHAADMRYRRLVKEREMDRLLTRKPSQDAEANAALLDDPEIIRRVRETDDVDVVFVVVATPVEEVGRDHDFDWAVLEPSSVHSIVQASGRVNRHRLEPVTRPNVAILRRNQKNLRYGDGEKAFEHPGNETLGIYDSHDAKELLGDAIDRIDAGLRFGAMGSKCLFSKLDDESIEKAMKTPFKEALSRNPGCLLNWAVEAHYHRNPLRSGEKKTSWLLRESESRSNTIDLFRLDPSGKGGVIQTKIGEGMFVPEQQDPSVNGYWIAPGVEETLRDIENDDRLDAAMRESAATFETYSKEDPISDFDYHLGGY